ncbi:MAG TPA: LLM class flavin-dependent oxidoreductase [Burkholderiales bacterium]|jgi:alkanesulfonate monooxygenase|nr:LLM class flavin-dependent oxidoreductase [Burkholderiales bacterium]
MQTKTPDHGLKIFTTCPTTLLAQPGDCFRQLEEMAQASEAAGCEGILVFTDNAQLDPWLVSQIIIEATDRLCPLVAIQPVYMHPYSVAKMITSLAFLHSRRLYLNMVAGGFKNDLTALNDLTPHDDRYVRLVEYTAIIQSLLQSSDAVSFEGRYYKVSNLKLTPPLPPELMPGILVSGSSEAGMQAARQLGATAVEYPKPPAEYAALPPNAAASSGIRIGIIARPQDADAWTVARTRYPEDRKGQLTHQLAMKVSDSSWHRQLSDLGNSRPGNENPYWLVPFQNYKAICPFLVGSYDRVAEEVARYVDAGYRTFILDVPASAEEMQHIGTVFERAVERSPAAMSPQSVTA